VSTGRRVLFLDRDGVINVDHGYVHRPEQTEWVEGIFDLCRGARAAGYDLVVVTNQAGIARGLYGEDDFARYCDWLSGQFAEHGCPLLAIYHCPHHPEAGLGDLRRVCDCRKPAPGMLLRARDEWGIDMARSALLGDQPSDILAARSAGVGRWLQLGAISPDTGHRISMEDACRWLASAQPAA
jgi:D,D-heptose 1,7-bisphosphate phosphatase